MPTQVAAYFFLLALGLAARWVLGFGVGFAFGLGFALAAVWTFGFAAGFAAFRFAAGFAGFGFALALVVDLALALGLACARALASMLFWALLTLGFFKRFEAFFATRLLVGIWSSPF
jgi:hypothetical protein